MTSDAVDPPDWEISTEAEFDSALQTLLLEALNNDLDIQGVWEYRNGHTYPDLEVLVTELAKSD